MPSNVGLQDAALISVIERYNEMLIERKRLLRTSTENNPAIVNLDTSIRAMKTNVQATLEGTLQGLLITRADLDARRTVMLGVLVMLQAGAGICKYCPSTGNQGRTVFDAFTKA